MICTYLETDSPNTPIVLKQNFILPFWDKKEALYPPPPFFSKKIYPEMFTLKIIHPLGFFLNSTLTPNTFFMLSLFLLSSKPHSFLWEGHSLFWGWPILLFSTKKGYHFWVWEARVVPFPCWLSPGLSWAQAEMIPNYVESLRVVLWWR